MSFMVFRLLRIIFNQKKPNVAQIYTEIYSQNSHTFTKLFVEMYRIQSYVGRTSPVGKRQFSTLYYTIYANGGR